MKLNRYIFQLIALITLAGCSKEPLEVGAEGDPTRISFGVTITDGYPQSIIKTRGTPRTGSADYENKKITVLAYNATAPAEDFEVKLSKSGDSWSYAPVEYYDALTYNFYAYASDLEITAENNHGIVITPGDVSTPPKLTYTVPTDVAQQPDLLIGDAVENKSSGKVSLSMYHALSCVGFVASSKHIGNDRYVRKVTVKNIYTEGSTTLAKKSDTPISWTVNDKLKGDFITEEFNKIKLEEGFDDITQNLTYLMKGDGYLMMVPQELPEGAQIEMEIWDGQNTTSIHTITYDIPPTKWEPGKKYMYYFDEPILDGVATYYEKYANGSLGFYYYDGETAVPPTLKDNSPIVDAGYGLLVPASTYTQYPSIYLGLAGRDGDSKDESKSDGSFAATLKAFNGVGIDCVLYPLSQNNYPYSRTATTRRGFQPLNTDKPVKMEAGVSETGSGKPINTIGYFLPHYAKGIYTTDAIPTTYEIRTPIQMRNISYQTDDQDGGSTIGKTYEQVETLDFSIYPDRTVYGKDITDTYFTESIVIGGFGGTYRRPSGQSYISGLIIQTPVNHKYSTSVFELVMLKGVIERVETKASCIYTVGSTTTADLYLAGIVAVNAGKIDKVVNRAALICNANNAIRIGGVVGLNAWRISNSDNRGSISNQSNSAASITGGVAAWNEKYYASWEGLPSDDKVKFKALAKPEGFSLSMDTEASPYPGAVVYNCKNYARVIGAANTGGIAGINNFGGVIFECTNTNNGEISSNINQTEHIIGGIVGLQSTGMGNNNTTNPPPGNDPPQFLSTIQSCKNSGNVTAKYGLFAKGNRAVGGIVGYNDFSKAEGTGYEIEAYGRVSQCVVQDAKINGYFSDVGGIAGVNIGNVNRSVCDNVYVGGLLGDGGADADKRNSAGGIVGCNNNFVSDCLFTHPSKSSSSISNVPRWVGQTSAGGIVGINNSPDETLKSPSSFVQRCVFAAIAPTIVGVGGEIGTFAPIAGWSGGYLFKKSNGEQHLQKAGKVDGVDATTGATPLYTLQDNYYASGDNYNFVSGNITFPNEPDYERIIPNTNPPLVIGPFVDGRYPYGQSRISYTEQSYLPVAGWYGTTWQSGSRPPIPIAPLYNGSYSFPTSSSFPPSSSGRPSLIGGIVDAIKKQGSVVSYKPDPFDVANTIRVSLNYAEAELNGVTSLEIDLSNAKFISNNAGGNGSIFFRAPAPADKWRLDHPNDTDYPKPYVMIVLEKDEKTVREMYWYCLVTQNSGKKIKMVKTVPNP